MSQIQEMFVDEAPTAPPTILDRSTLERWSLCPHSASLIAKLNLSTGSELADVGGEVHEIISAAVQLRHSEGAIPQDMMDLIESMAAKSRPDIQPQVILALRRAYPLVNAICRHSGSSEERSADDLLRFDGGEGEHGGQLAADLIPETKERGAVRLTCEVDLLTAGASVEEIDLWDWKSGFAWWTASDIQISFQFQFYIWVIFSNYPSVNIIRVRVFMVREGVATSPVEFRREELYSIRQRLMSAVNVWDLNRNAEPSDVPAWPSPAKCSFCPAVTRCRAVHAPDGDLGKDPEGYLRQFAAIDAARDRMHAEMSSLVRKQGHDLEFGDIHFGTGKPTKPRAKTCDLWCDATKED